MRFTKLLLLVILPGIACLSGQGADAAPRKANPADVCLRSEGSWTKLEGFVWTRLCREGHFDGLYDVPPRLRDPSTQRQPIHAAFLKTILTVSPYRERIEKGISLSYMRMLDELVINSTRLKGDIALGSFDAPQGITFIYVVLDGSLALNIVCLPKFVMAFSHVQGNFRMQSPETCEVENILMPKTEISGEFKLENSKFWFVDLSQIRTGRGLTIGGAAAVISLADAYVDGPVDLKRLHVLLSDLKRSDSLAGERKKREDKGRVLSLDGLHTTSTVDLSNVEVDGPVGLSDARIDGSLILAGGSFVSQVDVSNTYIAKRLVVGPVVSDYGGPLLVEPIRWGPQSLMNLNNTSIGAIATPLDLDSWPGKMDLNYLSFTTFVDLHAVNAPFVDLHVVNASAPDLDQIPVIKPPPTTLAMTEWFPKWLSRSVSDPFNPQPYETVGHYLTSIGQLEAAEAVGVAEKDHQLAQAWKDNNYGTCIFLLFSRATVLYGYQLWRAALWAMFFVVLGALVFRRTLEAYNNCMPIGLAYSFDMFIPLIKLRERHYKIELSGRARYYFYIHKLAGWVLGSFLVAAVSGLTK